METYNLNQTVEKLKGPTKEQIIFHNQCAAVALDRYHKNSEATVEFLIDGTSQTNFITWDSNFPKAAMKEKTEIANHGGVAFAWFIMSVLLNFNYVEQSEIGDEVDYRFLKAEPNDNDLNFFEDDSLFVEVSGILEESKSNTMKSRIQVKHKQINRGKKRNEKSSVIVTLFNKPKAIKEAHL